jgi:hypothetical protein
MTKADGGLRPLFKQNAPGFWQAIETGGTGKGIPDSHFIMEGTSGWIEFKQTEGIKVGLRPEQVAWISKYHRNGGNVWVGVRHKHEGGPRKGPPVDNFLLYRGSVVLDLARVGITLPSHFRCPTSEIPWSDLRSVLT